MFQFCHPYGRGSPADTGVDELMYEEKHYTPAQIAAMWNISQDSVRRLFKGEVGVLEILRPETRRKRAYSTLRVPESVLRRVHARLTKKATA